MKNLRKYFTKPMVFRHFYHTILQICYIPIKAPSMVVITIATNTTRHIIARSLCLFLLYTMLTSFLKCMPAAILIRCHLTLIGYPATFVGCPAALACKQQLRYTLYIKYNNCLVLYNHIPDNYILRKEINMIPIFSIIILILVGILTYQLRKTTNAQKEVEDNFWTREREANFVRPKDISNLCYITIPDGLLPLNIESDTEKEIATFIDKKMLNLTGMTNTDVKLEYGRQNFDKLSTYDDNFTQFIKLVPEYAKELMDANQVSDARNLLEFAVKNKADIRQIYQLLSSIYVDSGESGKINNLIAYAQNLDSLTKNMIINDMNAILNPDSADTTTIPENDSNVSNSTQE